MMNKNNRKVSSAVKRGNRLFEKIAGDTPDTMTLEQLKQVKKILMDGGDIMQIVMSIDDEILYRRESKFNRRDV